MAVRQDRRRLARAEETPRRDPTVNPPLPAPPRRIAPWIRPSAGIPSRRLGLPVTAAHSRPIGSTSRIGPVYTPPGLRGRGYAAGASEIVLFTDLANATSNGVCLRLGYVPLEDRVLIVPA
ncbi:hypothetical protein [Streptomyces sp. NRRL S-378]|uniref:GNAT family N-acetyltransferase n=1 Tax=Streptomyces sp. NRRL S-378 TaxID=1463904 RepID=UPI0004C9003E